MAVRNKNALVDVEDVKDVLDTGLTDEQINAYINMAYYRTIPLATNLGNCGGSAALASIQALLAAHFIATTREPQLESESIAGEASVRYRGKTDMGLNATTYGQQALALDCSGLLAKAGLKAASIKVWAHEDIDYDVDPDD